MFKSLLLLLLVFAMMFEPAPARAAAEARSVATVSALTGATAASADLFRRKPRKGRPNYMRYNGTSRKKVKKLGAMRRWKLRRKAQAKRRTGVPSVQAGPPTQTMKK